LSLPPGSSHCNLGITGAGWAALASAVIVATGLLVLFRPAQAASGGDSWRGARRPEAIDYQRGVTNLLTPKVFFEAMLIKGYTSLVDDASEVTIDQAARAAAELHKMTAADAGTEQMARIVATQNRIISAFRELPAQFQRQVLDTVEGRTTPPSGGARLAVIEGGVANEDEPDPFDGEDEEADDDD
jgi:hypothetical protein